MTDPTREQMLDEGRKQARINGVVPLFADVYAAGWAAAMARTDRAIEEAQRSADKSLRDANFNADLVYKGRIEELERQLRCVQLYGYGYLLNHGGKQIALDPKDVTVVLPATRHMDDFDLHNSLHLAEQQVQVLQDRIAEVREMATEAPANCGCHGDMCWPDHRCCAEVRRVDAAAILAVLDGEGEKASEPMLATLSQADIDSIHAIADAPYRENVHVELIDDLGDSTEDAAYDKGGADA